MYLALNAGLRSAKRKRPKTKKPLWRLIPPCEEHAPALPMEGEIQPSLQLGIPVNAAPRLKVKRKAQTPMANGIGLLESITDQFVLIANHETS